MSWFFFWNEPNSGLSFVTISFRITARSGYVWSADQLQKRFASVQYPRPIHLHFRILGSYNQRYPLLCRDYLRHHPAVAVHYAEFKRRLAREVSYNKEAYCEVKDPVFDLMMEAAEVWAAEKEWSPGPSDVPV